MPVNRNPQLLARWLAFLACLGLLPPGVSSFGAEWVDSHVSGPFECQSEYPLGSDSRAIDELEQLRNDVSATLGLEPVDEPIEILLFRTRRSYVNYISPRIPEGAGRQALYVKAPDMARVFVYRHRGFETDLRHEATHAVLHSALPYLPMWLDEGLAEYFEVPQPERASGNPHQFKVKLGVRFGVYAHLTALERKDELSDMDGSDYRQSWAWVHFLLHGPPEARAAFRDYVHDIRRGDPPGALSRYLLLRVPDLETRFIAHFKSWK